MTVVCLDLEGVLVPEIWISFAQKTGLDELKRTTRDEPDYHKLMDYRISILKRENLKLSDIQETISSIRPLDGAKEFLDELRSLTQVIILSDTFEEFAKPLMRQLGWPTIFSACSAWQSATALFGQELRIFFIGCMPPDLHLCCSTSRMMEFSVPLWWQACLRG